jgi:sterol-4alpha-carboxylate 3-dehydrogenase (decarboxylating)
MTSREDGAPSRACRSILITGGAGFLGRAIVHELQKPAPAGFASAPEIRIFDARPDAPRHPGVANIRGDVRHYEDLLEACRGVDVVLHAASLVDYGHASEHALEAINVQGTENAIRACREAGVPGLVYTSSMDVVYGAEPIVNGDETLPYPERFADAYARTKALAEQAVVAANGAARTARAGEADAAARLRTCVIRPCGMYGEADPYHVSGVLRTVQGGLLAARIGDGSAVFQHVYVGNVAHAHVLAAARLLEPESPAAGQACFVADKAVHDLGYTPIYSEAECLDRTAEWFRAHGPLSPPEIPNTR